MGAGLLAALYFLPPAGALVVLLIVCLLGLWEFYGMLGDGGIPHHRGVGMAGGVALLAATWWFFHQGGAHALDPDVEPIALFLIASAVFLRQMAMPSTGQALVAVSSTLLGVIYVAWLLNYINKLLLVFGVEVGRWLILYLVLVVKVTDIGAYFVGSRFGGIKFWPSISPAKTWSGVGGGLACGVAASMMALHYMQPVLTGITLTWADALALGLLLSVAGILGDLLESLLKRSAGVKDSGAMIQGMGGVLDVVDSLLFAAPFLYLYVRLFVDISP